MSFADLWQAQPEHFAQAAARWDTFGVALDSRLDELTRLIGTVGTGWEGVARDAAVAYLTGIAERIEGDLALVRQIPPVLREHSATVGTAQRLLHGAVAATRGTPIEIGPDGSVHISPQVAVPASLVNPALLTMLVIQARVIAEAIGQALGLAGGSDTQTASRLATLTPGRGSGASTGRSGVDVSRIPPRGTCPQLVRQWWDGLDRDEQQVLIHAFPQAIGTLDGLPAQARDQANRLQLSAERAALQLQAIRLQAAAVAGDPSAAVRRARVQDTLRALDAIERTLARKDRQLLLLDTSGRRVKAAVAVGNVDTADHVAVFTPGFTATVQDGLLYYDERMELLREQAQDESRHFGDADSVATVTWIGYEAPQWGEITDPSRSVIGDSQARAGGTALGRFLDGIHAARPDDPHLTAIGHSYGSTTTGYAVQQAGTVDEVIFCGSPGIGTSDVRELRVADGHCYVIEASDDPVADLGRFGADPNRLDGLTDLSSEAGRTPDRRELAGVSGHSGYLAADSISQYNVSVVVVGLADRADYGENLDFGDHARELLDDVGDLVDGAGTAVDGLVPDPHGGALNFGTSVHAVLRLRTGCRLPPAAHGSS